MYMYMYIKFNDFCMYICIHTLYRPLHCTCTFIFHLFGFQFGEPLWSVECHDPPIAQSDNLWSHLVSRYVVWIYYGFLI